MVLVLAAGTILKKRLYFIRRLNMFGIVIIIVATMLFYYLASISISRAANNEIPYFNILFEISKSSLIS